MSALVAAWHVVVRGHSMRVNRHITVPAGDSSRGWLYRCECDWTWAR